MYGLTPTRLAYLVIALVAGLALWSSSWALAPVRGGVATSLIGVGVVAAWGRFRRRAVDEWAVDGVLFLLATHRLRWTGGRSWRRRLRRQQQLEPE
jgi:uncharacterized membrane protein